MVMDLSKPARLQVDPDTISDDDKPPKTGDTFNIWYLKWSGGDGSQNYTKSKFKVSIAKDSGYTKAKGNNPVCLFFARGCCYQGKNCKYYHRPPFESDFTTPTQDCFGRDKTAEYRDDMDGVGSFNKHNRTLYVGGLHGSDSKLEQIITKHFEEFGDIEFIKVLYNKSCAFITFKLESQAQFVKEAMQNQSLEGNEILNLRWANEDPNPAARVNEKRKLDELTLETIHKLIRQTTAKKQKIESKEEEEVLPAEELKAIEAIPETSTKLAFNKDSLNKLRLLKKASTEEVKESPKSVALAIGDYSSDDE